MNDFTMDNFHETVRECQYPLMREMIKTFRANGSTERDIYRYALQGRPGLSWDSWQDLIIALGLDKVLKETGVAK